MRALVPTNATTGAVAVGTPAGIVASTNAFVPRPAIGSFAPLAGPSGTIVTILGTGFGGTTNVLFNGLTALFTVTSPNQIQATVPVGSGTGPITVSTPGGIAQSVQTFSIAKSADLALTFTTSAQSAILGALVTNSVTVTNQGPSEATGVVLTNSIPSLAQVVTVSVNRGGFQTVPGAVVAQFGTLPSGSSGTMTVVLGLTNSGSGTTRLQVAAAEFDPIVSNNDLSATTRVFPSPTSLGIQLLGESGIVLSWPVSPTNYQLELRDSLLPGSWTRVTNAPLVFSGAKSVALPRSTTPTRFFRLAVP